MQIIIVTVACVLFAASSYAHNTLFGKAPRTMYEGGWELEVHSEWELKKRFYEDDSPVANTTNRRMYKSTLEAGGMYGISRNFAVHFDLPVSYAVRTEKDTPRKTHFGLGDAHLALAYRLDDLLFGEPYVFPGGSFIVTSFLGFRLPTAEKRDAGEISFGDETFGGTLGLATALSTSRYYLWGEAAVDVSTRKEGSGDGMGFHFHIANAWRLKELKDYRETDYILLIEGDVATRAKGKENGKTDPNSGYFKTHLGVGLQVNLTNKYELKMGYNIPLYRNFNGRQFVHEGELSASFGILIR